MNEDKIHEQILSLANPHFVEFERPTPEKIWEFIGRMKIAFSEYDLDENKLFSDLGSKFIVSVVGDIHVIENDDNHEKWFNPDTNTGLNRDLNWHFWDHYKQYLIIVKKWNKDIIDSIDEFSSKALSRMEDPKRMGAWDRRGMIVGNVQSGKTANYTALIAKALDAGYKLIVILSGAHDDLRAQTQARINEELLGYDREEIRKATGDDPAIGVRKLFLKTITISRLIRAVLRKVISIKLQQTVNRSHQQRVTL